MSDLQDKLMALKAELETAKKARADANSIVKGLAAERRTLMANKIKLMDNAKTERALRDVQNKLAKEQKEKRDSLKGSLSEARGELTELRDAQKLLRENVHESKRDIERDLRELRNKLQRERIKPNQEDRLIKQIEELEYMLNLFNAVRNARDKLKKANFNFGELQAESHAHHKMVVQYAGEGGQHHVNMQELYNKANVIQKDIDALVEKINEKQKFADEMHNKVIDISKKLNEVNGQLGLKTKLDVETKVKEVEAQATEYTESILEKLKSGEKISV